MCAGQPPLQKRDDQVYARQQSRDFFGPSPDRRHLVIVSLLLQSCIALPAVGMHCAAGLDAIFNERMEAGDGGVLDYPHANSTNAPSVRLRRYHNQSLVLNSPAYSAFLRTLMARTSEEIRPTATRWVELIRKRGGPFFNPT